MKIQLSLVVLLAAIGPILCQESTISIGTYNNCEGKDSGNYTHIAPSTSDDNIINSDETLILCSGKEQSVNGLQILAKSEYPAGANEIYEVLYLIFSGPLQGKFAYLRVEHQQKAYLKRFSSVLASSLVGTSKTTLLISDKLDPNTLISPIGGFEVFKKGCTTICNGQEYSV